MSNNQDPLEAAKIINPERRPPGRPPALKVSSRQEEPFAQSPQRPQLVTASAEDIEQADAPTPATDDPEVPLRSFRVLESRTMSWYGTVTHLAAHSIVTEGGYGKEGIQRLITQGVKLQEILPGT